MTIKIGISFINSVLGGPRTVALNIIKYLSEIDQENQYIIFTDSSKDLEFLQNVPNFKLKIIKRFSKYDLLFWEQILLPYYAKKYKIDILHGMKNSIPILGNFKKIATIHDLAYYIMPETFSFLQKLHLYLSTKIIKKYADKIVAVSHNTAKDITNILKIPNEKIAVIYNGIDKVFFSPPSKEQLEFVKKTYQLPSHFFLHVGTLQPRKNIENIIKSFILFKKETNDKDFYLILVGRKGWYYNKILNLLNENIESKWIKFIGEVQFSDLLCFYYLSYAFIYLSNYDGFGLVPLEAMATGKPVIASNVSSLPEVIAEGGILVNQYNIKEVKEAIEKLINDNIFYNKISQKAFKQAQKFLWNISAKNYFLLYKNLYSQEE